MPPSPCSPEIDPRAYVAPTAVIRGCVSIGPRSSVWDGAVVRGDLAAIYIGPDTNLQEHVVVHADPDAPCIVGARVSVGHGAVLHGCTVGDDALVGIGAIVLNGARVAEGSVVAAGAVVLEGVDVPPGSLAVGVPAQVRRLPTALLPRIDQTWRIYVELATRARLLDPPPRADSSEESETAGL